MTKAVAEGLPKHRIEEAAAARAAKVDTGETTIVGVNRYRLAEEPPVEILEVDNAKVRSQQIAKIEKVRASRDEAKVRAALDALEAGARAPQSAHAEPVEVRAEAPTSETTLRQAQGERNLLALAVECARVRCTLGEISDAV